LGAETDDIEPSVLLVFKKLSDVLSEVLCFSAIIIGAPKAILSAASELETCLLIAGVIGLFSPSIDSSSIVIFGYLVSSVSSIMATDCAGRLGKVISSSSKSSRSPSRLMTTRLLLLGLFISLP